MVRKVLSKNGEPRQQVKGDTWKEKLGKFLVKHLSRKKRYYPISPAELEPVSTINVPETKIKLVASQVFVRNVGKKAILKIGYVSEDFRDWFLGKTEDPLAKQTLYYYKLLEPSGNGPIVAKLGGEEKAETTLTEIYGLMAKQANGCRGPLITNNWWNIFFVRDQKGVLRVVHLCWYDDGWYVYARAVNFPASWYAGHMVFSRNSVPKPQGSLVPVEV